MTGAREKLHSARETLGPILGRRRTTTEEELDECVRVLEELKRACRCPLSAKEAEEVQASFDEVITRLRNRSKKGTTP